MIVRWGLPVVLFFAAGCAGPAEEGYTSVEMKVERKNTETDKNQVVAQLRDLKPEPVYSTSVAINLAELAMKGAGVDFKRRNVAVSFCDGVYTVTFERPETDAISCDFTVDIDANSSRVLKVVTAK